MSTPKYTLYSSELCPYAQRARVAALETGFKATEIEIDLTTPREPWYLEINPYGQVPALKLEGEDFVFLESKFVAKYIAELSPKSGLIVDNARDRAHSEFLIHQFDNRVIPAFYKLAYTKDTTKRAEHVAEFDKQLTDFTRYLEKAHASTGAGPFIHGARFTYADLVLGTLLTRLYLAEAFQQGYKLPSRESHPHLARYFEWQDAVLARPSIIATTPDREADTKLASRYVR
ncbi:hypothetical protein DFQ27_005186 [Actinomortierella ambigua]|uniref:Glutathione S-transferase n=1 Tax=Actinomortierella ambigua TaxID=1343610 RepID=A0A9P6U397_9FUNG|nr:hypothetical protein DFQ26_003238 [Actinomortierella ambigua]KAG0257354.1 hypothetical protein DFQ27_005186 [Actinomortierella ambigua]